jgi:hypothetical protein
MSRVERAVAGSGAQGRFFVRTILLLEPEYEDRSTRDQRRRERHDHGQ